MVAIVTYKQEYNQYFEKYNTEWLNKYFMVEAYDKHQFDTVQENIIDKGGQVFFVKVNNEIVGTAAVQPMATGEYELTKMAVTQAHQGLGYGRLLVKACIKWSIAKKLPYLLLWSNTTLTTAIAMYKLFGFEEVALEQTNYNRANIKMKLTLSY